VNISGDKNDLPPASILEHCLSDTLSHHTPFSKFTLPQLRREYWLDQKSSEKFGCTPVMAAWDIDALSIEVLTDVG